MGNPPELCDLGGQGPIWLTWRVACADQIKIIQSLLHSRDHFMHAPSQWEATLQCKVNSHWLGAYTKRSMNSITSIIDMILLKFYKFWCCYYNKHEHSYLGDESVYLERLSLYWSRTLEVSKVQRLIMMGVACPSFSFNYNANEFIYEYLIQYQIFENSFVDRHERTHKMKKVIKYLTHKALRCL